MTFLKFLPSTLETDVLKFITSDLKIYPNEIKHWLKKILTDDRLVHYKRRIVNFCVHLILGMLPCTAVLKLDLPPVIEEFIAEEHNDKMLDWTKILEESKKYNLLQYEFWTRRQHTTQEPAVELTTQILAEIKEDDRLAKKADHSNPMETKITDDKEQSDFAIEQAETQSEYS